MTLVRKLRDLLAARSRRRRYEPRIERFVREKTGRADRLPAAVVYEATMRCNLACAPRRSIPVTVVH